MEILVPGDRATLNLDKIVIKKVNRSHPHLLFGELEYFLELSDDYEFLCYSYKKTGNAYKRMAYKFGPAKACVFLNSEKIFYPEIHKITDFPPIGTCPWAKGKYHINGWQPVLSSLPPVFKSGDYMVEMHIRKIGDESKVLQGVKVYGTLLNTARL